MWNIIILNYANELIIDLCDDVTCQNGGTCIIEGGKASCACADGYGGKKCEKRE